MNKSKIFILGSIGMAGHTIAKFLKLQNKYDIYTLSRGDREPYPTIDLDVKKDLQELELNILGFEPDYIINCIGILLPDSKKEIGNTIWINSYFPHWLENITKNTKTKIIHLSTDCVFDGTRGDYISDETPTETNIYGRTKALGEIINDKDLTIRLSIIGRELKTTGSGLLEWVLKQKGTIKGYSNHYWSGITTLCLAQNIDKIINTNITGLYQLAPNYRITKYSLLKLIQKVWNKNDITIQSYIANYCDKTLTPSYRIDFEPIMPEDYETMLTETKQFNENHE